MTPDAYHAAVQDLRAELAFKRTIFVETIDRVRVDLLEELIRRAGAGDAFGWWLATRSIASPHSHLRNEAERQWAWAWAKVDRTRRTSVAP